ncbi:hypothetical protein SETIT_1G119900v2 [Setaria italica]|uniref:Helicase C-terminal domain-containing protein n=1 Tax=Setaria italica TaxID=4555 RepID=A0A368PJD3_SETIT|nr:uncharacterized protein LOC101783548 [Setaria italica]RCV05901.1 hypothetical protein SETIT_1G119900v2 [Setaria italica]
MANIPEGSLIDGTAGSNTTSGNGGPNAISAPHLRSRQLFNVPTARRRSSRTTPNPFRGHPPTRLGSEALGSYEKKRKAPTEEAPSGISEAVKVSNSAPLTPRDPNRTYSSKDGAKGRFSEHAMVENAWSSPKKRRCTRISNYLSQFTPSSKGKATAVVVRSEQSSIPQETNKFKESPFQNLQRLPDGCHPDFDNDHLCSVNKLREFWHKSQGAVFVDDKEHVTKTILFILSVLPDACQPFLLLTTASLPLWKAEFSCFAPCINVVVYDGEKDVHKLVQNPEFHENGRHTTLHVLLSHPDSILENIKNVDCIGWEAVIVDYCQSSILKQLKQLKQLPTGFRMVLLSSPLKDNLLEYKNLLAFLNSEQEDNGAYVDADALAMLRARFTRHIAYERKAGSSNFLEYWVPAYLSQVQLELYSFMLLENSSILQSKMATDSVGALRDIVMCLWKCCNHPCLIGLEHSPGNTCGVTESMDDRMRESGKLQLLEKMLKEIRNKRLRVIVLFQSDGAVGDGTGNILEELIRHRFGRESYVRVQNRSAFSMKREAMNMFNDTTKGRFVFLIDSRACHSSINLSSVDTIIIYGSDLNPLNDLKALRKIKIESQLKFVRIFRLYTPFTVEEKGLVLAKQGMIVDSNGQDILPSLSHCFLSWGVSFLFSRVDELRQDNCASKSYYERGMVFMDKVILEFLAELSTDVEDSCKVNNATISKACMSGEFYSRNITLIGEREGVSSLDEDPPKFWLNLLDGESRGRRYKRINVPTGETKEARTKLSKTGEIAGSSSKFSSDVINDDLFPEIGTSSSADLHLLPETGMENLSTPKSLHAELKHELSKLIKVLKLPDNVCSLANQLLEYLLKNHLVVREPQGTQHMFNIALCWFAAYLLKYTKLDHQESLALAAEGLNYECNEELTRFFYKKLRLHKPGGRRNIIQTDRFSPHESSSANLRSDHIFPKHAIDCHDNFTNGTQESSSASEKMVSDGQELVSSPEADREWHLSSEEPPGRTATQRIDLFKNIFSLREKNIIEKQQLEISKLSTQRDNEVMKLKEVCHAVVQHIRISDIDEEIRNDQIKLVINWFTMLMYAFLAHMKLQLSKLEARQSSTWVEEQLMKEKLKHEVLSGPLDQFLDLCNTLPDSNFAVEEFIHFKKQNGDNHVDNILALGCDQLMDDGLMEITLVRNSVPSEAFSTCVVRNEPTETHMRSGGGAASESLDLPDDNISCSSDGVDLQRTCSASTIPANHDSINQESSTGEARSVEHAKRDNIADPSILPGSVTSPVMGTNADDDGTVAADPCHLEFPILASPQNLMTLQNPPAEADPTDTLLAMAARDLQTEMQTPCPTLDVQHRRVCPDDSSKMNLELDTAAEMLHEGTTSDHLGDSSTGVKDKNADTVASDPLNSESQYYNAPQNPVVLPDGHEVETQTDQSSMPAQHSTSLAAQQNLAISGYPPVEAESSSNLDMDAARSLQPDIQPSSSMLDADSSQTARQPETTPVLSQGGSTSQGFGVDNNGTVCAHQAHSESPTFAAPQSPDMLLFSSEVGIHANLSSTPSLQSSDADTPSRPPPAVAESPGMLGTQVEQNLHPDIAPSTSLSGVQLQGMFLDERSPAGCRSDGVTDLSEESETEYLTGATCNLATVPVYREAETEDDQASVPAQEIRSPHAQRSLATSQLPVDDLQQPTLILSEEAERAGTLCATAAQDLQNGMQPSITTQDARLNRTDLSGMPVTRSTTILQSVEPSSDPHAEQAGSVGMLSAPDLQHEVQPSPQMQDQPAEMEGAGTSGTIAAQNLQPETQSSTSVQHIPPERTHPDERIQIGLQPSSTSGPEHYQLFTVPPAAVNNLSHSSEPLINEYEKLKLFKAAVSKQYDQQKSKLQTECNQEMEKIVKKYELLLQKEEHTYHRSNKLADDMYMKLFLQQSLAENFQEKFMKSIPAQVRSMSPTIQQAPQSFQPALSRMSVAQTTSLPVASPPWLNSSHSTGPFLQVQPSQVARPSASEAVQPQPVILPGSLYRATPPPASSMPLRNGSYGRGPAPHLQQQRMLAASALALRDQQQLAAMSPGVTSSRQSAPGSATELMANFLQSPPSTTPVPMAAQQASGLIPGLHHMPGGPPNGAAGIRQSGGHLAVMNQAAPEPSPEAMLLFQRRWRTHPIAPPSSVHRTVASASNPHPGLAAAASSTNRYLMATQQALILNPAPGSFAGPANAAAGWHGGATIPAAVASQPAPGPALSNVQPVGRTGQQTIWVPVGAGGQGGAMGEVVCVSDDDDE